MTPQAPKHLALAIDLFAKGSSLLQGCRYRHVEVGLFSEREADQFENLTRLIEQYLSRKDPPRPLCLAVFGAPGSGKSRLVKNLPSQLGETARELANLTEINLTQVTSVDHLASALDDARDAADQKVPFVFFDEFDTKLDGAPWGWLYWFLAPMQDGVFRREGQRRKLKRAVYIFAGGTASSFEQFSRADRDAFAIAKGPDFVSRLRGYLDIPGVNADEDRSLRRALVLRHLLNTHKQTVDPRLLAALLDIDRYKHGARSIEALIELMPPKQTGNVTIADIKDHPLLTMHLDRGLLDARTIGGCIGLSGSDVQNQVYIDVVTALCETLFREGATIGCGGQRGDTQLFISILGSVVNQLSDPLVPTGKRLMLMGIGAAVPPQDNRVEILPPLKANNLPTSFSGVENPLKLFQKRYQLALRCVAQFAIGGRLNPSTPGESKRYPGVVEEIMLAIAMKHPVYISAKLAGGAEWAGVLLGLGRTWAGPSSGFDQDWLQIPPQAEILFRPPPLVDLPLTRDDLIKFFRNHALGGPNWVNNGLSVEENRELFETTSAERIVGLVRRGLRECFARASQ